MKLPVLLLSVLLLPSTLRAQVTDPSGPIPVQVAPRTLNSEELSQLLGPIALYPDALVALILPASTVPSDVVLGARYLRAKNDPDLVANQPWDESVRSLVRYPDVLTWMDENLEWTASVGEAFVEQPADVMNAIQALRARAQAAGNLKDTPEQRVVVREEIIRIIPADPEYIFVPQYDPQVVFVQSYNPAPVLTFGLGFAVGAWLNYDFDWNQGCLYRGDWRGWNNNRGNNWNDGGWNGNSRNNNNVNNNNSNVNVINIDNNNITQWRPTTRSVNQIAQRQRTNSGNARFVRAREAALAERQAERRDVRQADRLETREAARTNLPTLPQPTRLTPTQRQDRRDQKISDREARRDLNDGQPQNVVADLPSNDSPTSDTKKERPRKTDEATLPDNRVPAPSASPAPADTRPPSVSPREDRKEKAAERDALKPRPNVAPSTAPTVPGELARPDRPDRPRKEAGTPSSPENASTPPTSNPAKPERKENDRQPESPSTPPNADLERTDRKERNREPNVPSAPPATVPAVKEPTNKVRESKSKADSDNQRTADIPPSQRETKKSTVQTPNRPSPAPIVLQTKKVPVQPKQQPRQQEQPRPQQQPRQQEQPRPQQQRKEQKQAAKQSVNQKPVPAPSSRDEEKKEKRKKKD